MCVCTCACTCMCVCNNASPSPWTCRLPLLFPSPSPPPGQVCDAPSALPSEQRPPWETASRTSVLAVPWVGPCPSLLPLHRGQCVWRVEHKCTGWAVVGAVTFADLNLRWTIKPQGTGVCFGENMAGRAGLVGSAHQPGESSSGAEGARQLLRNRPPQPVPGPPFLAAVFMGRPHPSEAQHNWGSAPGQPGSTAKGSHGGRAGVTQPGAALTHRGQLTGSW